MIPSLRKFLNEILVWTSLVGGGLLLVLPERTWLSLLWRIPLLYLIYQVWRTYRMVHPARLFSNLGVLPDEAGLAYAEVNFPSRDGLQLAGFLIEGSRLGGLILVHGAGGSAGSMVDHAVALAELGCSMLLLDLRAHGHSAGDTMSFGLREAQDVLGAADYLQSRFPALRGQIGVLGISLGAQAGLRAALVCPHIRVLVLEGLGGVGLRDLGKPKRRLSRLLLPLAWLLFRLGDLMSGVWFPEPTVTAIQRVTCPLLLISTDQAHEQAANRRFFAAASQPKELLELPQARHAAGLFFEPQKYQAAVTAFFRQALLPVGRDERREGE